MYNFTVNPTREEGMSALVETVRRQWWRRGGRNKNYDESKRRQFIYRVIQQKTSRI